MVPSVLMNGIVSSFAAVGFNGKERRSENAYICPGWIILIVWHFSLQRMLLATSTARTKAARSPWEEAAARRGLTAGT